ncbi:Serine/threonine-protein phosphatase 2A activator [Tupaia chinensis]|uniref:Serine/threonine-protein phosphatase 2A activator n=1 Tax=Tupaia chinensis TaxID=246437 RepID=L9KGG7_TUPCH|nr:Serine/threonine-protein phosphatase 2A activator [Tupaia chinensis]
MGVCKEAAGSSREHAAYADYIGFILTLNEGVKGKKLTFEYKVSEAIEKLVSLLNTLDRWIDETPPVDQPSRFGNKAYRTWYAKLDEEAENLVATVVPTHLAAAVPEVAVYLKESVGNSTRIDYGTGHEAAFAAFLCCLCKIGVLRVDDQIAIVFKVFNRYLEVMRKLQKTYRMEPAGSQGVWGLDDFQFLPFIWGSSQLIDHPHLEPRHFVDEKAVNENHEDFMFLECVRFITEMKTGPFAEHSNQLWNISAVPSWSKVNQGLIRMYKAESPWGQGLGLGLAGRGRLELLLCLGTRVGGACCEKGWLEAPGAGVFLSHISGSSSWGSVDRVPACLGSFCGRAKSKLTFDPLLEFWRGPFTNSYHIRMT